MSAAVLREAAALMRERAERVETTGQSVTSCAWDTGHALERPDGTWMNWTPATYEERFQSDYGAAAEHFASWPPVVALAVAEWLETVAERVGGKTWSGSPAALKVARAYLRTTP